MALSFLYDVVTRVRNSLYDVRLLAEYRSALPVVSVGNISVGGNGKSPFSAFIAEQCLSCGLRPAILSRGYGGSEAGPYVVKTNDDVSRVGDEALMQKQRFGDQAQVVISRKRVSGVKLIEAERRADIIILDDGLQHRAIGRDTNLILIDVTSDDFITPYKKRALLPFGPLREEPCRAFARATGVVLVKRGEFSGKEEAQLRDEFSELPPCIHFELKPACFVEIYSRRGVELSEFSGKSVVAACGIAKPEGFFSLLQKLGLQVEQQIAFSDHQLPAACDWPAGTEARPLIVTEKDAVKIQHPLPNTYYLKLSGDILDRDEATLEKLLALPLREQSASV